MDETPNILDEIIQLSGLDKNIVMGELKDYLNTSGKKAEDLTLNEIRNIIIRYARRIVITNVN
jgi:hypothetical protein